ncbi:MAG TPA: DUF3365 domain-containing protein [Vicinamibacterales bacterium]|nr:DUF3365 domain-containing protein [Vicinamibacterales bacterium]
MSDKEDFPMQRNIPQLTGRGALAAAALTLALAAAAFVGAQPAQRSWRIRDAPPQVRDSISRADLVIAAMQDSVLRELTTQLAAGSTSSALAFCHVDAGAAARRIAAAERVEAGRTSDRLRNPGNAPRPWAAPLVAENAGKRSKDVDGFVVDLGDRIGVLRPIAQGAMCARCHGPRDALAADVKAALAQRYPHDRATGFKEGEIRGWFWVEMPMSPR